MLERFRIDIEGGVQGVGFRPFVYRLALEHNLNGWVCNSPSGVSVEVEGLPEDLTGFKKEIQNRLPPAAFILSMKFCSVQPLGEDSFQILSSKSGHPTAVVVPDMATCTQCISEIFDPDDRRYLYPFTNCTNCGPRYTIIKCLPYDRPFTSMAEFTMCPECVAEYTDPLNRRFHAQPNACPVCGPEVVLWDFSGKTVCKRNEAMREAARLLTQGNVLAVKGLGGFHLMVRADDDNAVLKLRSRKNRPAKPFAVMIPSHDLLDCSSLASETLSSTAAPIVLLERETVRNLSISNLVAPGNHMVGVMLPYTPFHHILMKLAGIPIITTSGNLAAEPICIDSREALFRLSGIADYFLVHNRQIVRHVDDSVVVVSREGVTPIRRSRGYVPLPISVKGINEGILALGGHERNTIAITLPGSVVISQHIGDMINERSLESALETTDDLSSIYSSKAKVCAVDMHPDYTVSRFASPFPLKVQHHHAHVLSCMAENGISGPVIGVVWDGSGYGTDGSIWGGEFLFVEHLSSFSRFAHFRQFRLPGGESAVKYPRKTAAGMLYEAGIRDFTMIPSMRRKESDLVAAMLTGELNCPVTSSVGRLFDGMSAILGLCSENRYSGQAAIAFQGAIAECDEFYPVRYSSGIVDWVPMLLDAVEELSDGVEVGIIAAKFHNWLAEVIIKVVKDCATNRVVLTGGCFQNTYLLDRSAELLRKSGCHVYRHCVVPPGDGGLSLGQAVAVMEVNNVSGYSRKDS
ncbi:MAG: carbamoyltransferase HypF [Candidatus Sabulitectum sp.]|nr:carbamoyltransferase HypF [Candidatus Sabulitectum sp.]